MIVLVGANPGLLLREGDRVTAFASVWDVDYSERGSGTALVLWHNDRVRTIGTEEGLAPWLADTFVRHFPEVAGLPWLLEQPEHGEVDVEIDLAVGMRARAAEIELSIGHVLDHRVFSTDAFPLGDGSYALSNVYAPCGTAQLSIEGAPVAGVPDVDRRRERPTSSAFLAVAEVWSRS